LFDPVGFHCHEWMLIIGRRGFDNNETSYKGA
jgi:hypothetical protein